MSKNIYLIFIGFCLITACNSASEISEPIGKILFYGNLDRQLLSKADFKNNSYFATTGFDIEDKELFILKNETFVPPVREVVFGYKLLVENLPSGEVILERKLRYPEKGDCVLGSDSVLIRNEEFNVDESGVLHLIVAQEMSEQCEYNFGLWELSVSYQGKELASMTFETEP